MQQRRRRLERPREQRPESRVVARGRGPCRSCRRAANAAAATTATAATATTAGLFLLARFVPRKAGDKPIDDGAQVVGGDLQRERVAVAVARGSIAVAVSGSGAHRGRQQSAHETLRDGQLPVAPATECLLCWSSQLVHVSYNYSRPLVKAHRASRGERERRNDRANQTNSSLLQRSRVLRRQRLHILIDGHLVARHRECAGDGGG